MRRFLRQIMVLTVIMAVCFSFIGCENRNSIWRANLSAPFSVVYHSVPFATGDSVWDEAQLLETDQYGRELYFYVVSPDTYLPARDLVGPTKISFYILVICQKTENSMVYYYEDQCYYLLRSKDYSDIDLEAIKTANDWNMPFDTSKMISVEDSFSQNFNVDQEKCIDAFSKAVNIDEKYELVFDVVSVNNGESLCVIREYYTKNKESECVFGTNYIALFNQDSELIRYSSFDGSFIDFPTQIMQFKKIDENG